LSFHLFTSAALLYLMNADLSHTYGKGRASTYSAPPQ